MTLPWGSDTLELAVPDAWTLIHPRRVPDAAELVAGDELGRVAAALAQPLQTRPLHERDLAGKQVLLIIDDNTRPTPIHRFLHLLLDQLEAAGAGRDQILLLTALGIHSPLSEQELAKRIGPANLERLQWRNHDAFDPASMHDFGHTGRGTPIVLNRAAADADLIVLVGMVEPHLWAGYGGGLKNIFPGVASVESISAHHAIIAEPPYLFNRVGMEPADNSFRLDLEEVQRLIPAPIFCLNVSVSHRGAILGAFAGDPVAAHRAAVAFNKATSGRVLDQQVDGIIVNSFPMDINFKQSMKGVGNSLPALKPGGVIMGFLCAERGLDDIELSPDSRPLWLVKTLLRLLGAPRIMWFLERTYPDLNVEDKFLRYYSMQLIRQYELYFHVPVLSDEEVKRLGFFENYRDPQALLARAAKKLGRAPQVAVFPEAGATFPIVGRQ